LHAHKLLRDCSTCSVERRAWTGWDSCGGLIFASTQAFHAAGSCTCRLSCLFWRIPSYTPASMARSCAAGAPLLAVDAIAGVTKRLANKHPAATPACTTCCGRDGTDDRWMVAVDLGDMSCFSLCALASRSAARDGAIEGSLAFTPGSFLSFANRSPAGRWRFLTLDLGAQLNRYHLPA